MSEIIPTGPDPRRMDAADARLDEAQRRLEEIERRCEGVGKTLGDLEARSVDDRLTESATRILTAVAFITAAATAIFNTMKSAGRSPFSQLWATWFFFAFFVFAISGLTFLLGTIWPIANGRAPRNIPTLLRWGVGAIVCSLFCLLCLASTPFLDHNYHVPWVPTGLGVALLSLTMAIAIFSRNGSRPGNGALLWGVIFVVITAATGLGIWALHRAQDRSPRLVPPITPRGMPAATNPVPESTRTSMVRTSIRKGG